MDTPPITLGSSAGHSVDEVLRQARGVASRPFHYPAISQEPCPEDIRRLGRALWSFWKLKPAGMKAVEYLSESMRGMELAEGNGWVESLILALWECVWDREKQLLVTEMGDANG